MIVRLILLQDVEVVERVLVKVLVLLQRAAEVLEMGPPVEVVVQEVAVQLVFILPVAVLIVKGKSYE